MPTLYYFLDKTLQELLSLKAVYKVFQIITRLGPLHDSGNNCESADRPKVGGETVDSLLRESLEPRKNRLLLVRGKVHRNLKDARKEA